MPFLAGSWYKPREDPADRGLLVRRDIVTVNDELEWVGMHFDKESHLISNCICIITYYSAQY